VFPVETFVSVYEPKTVAGDHGPLGVFGENFRGPRCMRVIKIKYDTIDPLYYSP